MRNGLRDADVLRLAALLRGGHTWEEAISEFTDVPLEALTAWKAIATEEAAQPGRIGHLRPPPLTEAEALEHSRLLFSDRRTGLRVTIKER